MTATTRARATTSSGHPGPARRVLAAAVVGGLVLAGCADDGDGAGAVVTDEATALQAVVDTLTGSWTWSGRLDLDVTDAHVAAVVDSELAREAVPAAEQRARLKEQAREAIDEAGRSRMHGAWADDRSWRAAWERDDRDLVDLRADVAEVFQPEELTPEAAVLLKVDAPGLLALWEDVTKQRLPLELAELRAQAKSAIDDPDVLTMVLALLDGSFAGPAGTVDLASLGATEADLDEIRREYADEFAGLADRETLRELLDAAVTVTDVSHVDGTTTARLDVHPRDAAFAVHDLFDDAEHLARGVLGTWQPDEELPVTLHDVATLQFDADGRLTEVRTDVLQVARELAPLARDAGLPDTEALLDALDGAQADVVFGFGDHGAVTTTTDVEATTVPWGDLAAFFFGGLVDGLG